MPLIIENQISVWRWKCSIKFLNPIIVGRKMYDFIVDYFKVTDCNLDGAEYECQRRQQLQNTLLNTAYKQA